MLRQRFIDKFFKRVCRSFVVIFVALYLVLLVHSSAFFSRFAIVDKARYSKRTIWNFVEKSSTTAVETAVISTKLHEQESNSQTAACECENIRKRNYLTSSFSITCEGGLSNRLFELVSLYGIARSLNRTPFINLFSGCVFQRMVELTSLFPNLAQAFELRLVEKNLTRMVPFGRSKCCTYENLTNLLAYNSSQYLTLDTFYLQSFKYFHMYKTSVMRLLQFTSQDVETADKLASAFSSSVNYRLCVHIRRGDYLNSPIHQWSTETFTIGAVLYLREKLHKASKNPIVIVIGDDREWAKKLFEPVSWAHVPPKTNRSTTDYAFIAKHCQTILITASASTFAWWSAYLSSADAVYYNKEFATGPILRNELTPNDFYLPSWIPLAQNKETMQITEEERN